MADTDWSPDFLNGKEPPHLVTIGVYGFDEVGFFRSLTAASVDAFCDVRARRGVRGAKYAFANSKRLQARLADLGIHYRHFPHLAPTADMREQQYRIDKSSGIAKRKRAALDDSFIRAYEAQILDALDTAVLLEEIGEQAGIVALFCVEDKPEACHRSLLAARLAEDWGTSLEHITAS